VICPACQAENDDGAARCSACGASLAEATTSVVVAIDLRPGSVFDERYEIRSQLGQGGMGMVYRAHDRSLDEEVAIKVLRPDFAQDPKMAERFKSEIKLARKVRHKNVCAIHDYGEDRGLLYISMELVQGTDLKHVLRQRGALPPAEAYDVAIQVAEGLQAVHDAGIIHRDLKTPNIMLDQHGTARLMDFGIAKRQEGGGASTATGHVLGTPEYMSPEQAQGFKVDARTDVYALGVLIFETFTGHVPFRGDTPISTILKHLHEAPPLDAAALPPSLRPVLRRAMAKDPAQRYASARELAEALREARQPSRRQQPVPTEVLEAPTLPQPRSGPPPSARRSSSLSPWLLAIPLLAVGGGTLALLTRPGKPASAPPPTSLAALATPVPATLPPSTVAAAPVLTPTTTPTTLAPTTTRPAPTPRPRPSPSTPAATPPAITPPATTAVPATTTTTLPAEPGLLQVAVRPWAEVRVDGKVIGTTPLDRISLAPGAHVVVLRHPGFELLTRPVTIRSGEVLKLVVDLAKEGTPRQD
jgi:serine/threonine-protein kinase